jgi:hypothetical protein
MSEILDIARRYVVDGRRIIAEQQLRIEWGSGPWGVTRAMPN